MTEAEAAWAAGLFEGEGSILHVPRKGFARAKRRSLAMGSTDLDVLEHFRQVVGCGTIHLQRIASGNWKTMHQWVLYDYDAIVPLLTAMLPWFGQRRAEKARGLLADPPLAQGRHRCLPSVAA